MWAVRVGLPALVAAGGLILIVAGHGTGVRWLGIALIGTALLVVIANVLMRLGIASQADRDEELRARQYFSRTGHWPDEDPPAAEPQRRSPPPGAAPTR
jgi:hypothetical protein